MRIVIDMQGAQTESRFRGIGRYSLSLAQAIARNAGSHEIWLVFNGQLPEHMPALMTTFADLLPPHRMRIFDVPCVNGACPWLARASEIIREKFLSTLEPDFILLTSLFEGYCSNAVTSIGASIYSTPTAVILYDLIPFLNRDMYLPNRELQDYYNRKIQWLENADLILAISESSRREGIEHLGLAEENITNISAAIDSQFYPQQYDDKFTQALLDKFLIKRKPILYAPGGFDHRKNFARLIEAYSLLKGELREQFQLVIVSKLSADQRMQLSALISKFGLSPDDVILTSYIEDNELIAMYSLAELFVFPSTHEGFGLPILEAMACGAPVIGSNCSSVPEVIGCVEALFDPFSVKSISEKMTKALTNDAFRTSLREHSRLQVKKFSWDSTALRALAAMDTMLPLKRTALYSSISPSTLVSQLAVIAEEPPGEGHVCEIAQSIAYNRGNQGCRQLLLDVSTIVHSDAKSGIQRVVRSLLQELLASPPDGVAVRPVYLDNGLYFYADCFTARITGGASDLKDFPIDFYQDDIYLSLDLNMHLTDQFFPLLNKMKQMGVRLNFIVYDLLLIHRPDWWPAPTSDLFNHWLLKITLLADNICCISRAVSDELQDWLSQNSPERPDQGPKLHSFHLGADISNSLPTGGFADNADTILKIISSRPSFLLVGTIEPRKGHKQAIEAFEKLWENGNDVNLVIIGKSGWLVEYLLESIRQHPELHNRLLWLEGISDEYLEKIYAASTCLIAASEGEGFGLPLIEAAQHNLPIIARDIPVFREVAENYAYYFSNDRNPATLSKTILEWLNLYESDNHPKSDKMPWLTWKESTQRLLRPLLL